MLSRDKVSIVVPVYNVEKYISKCIDSILSQSYDDIEVLIVNDGSTDNSDQIVRQYAKKDSRIKYFTQKNSGLSSARNTGIKNSSGEYICFVDSDDWVSRDYIEKMHSLMVNDGSDMAICGMCYIYADGKVKKNTPVIKRNRCINKKEAIACLLEGKEYKFHAVNKMYKKRLFTDNNILFPTGKVYEDMFTTYRLMLRTKKVSLVKDSLYYYLQNRDGSILHQAFNKKRLDMLKVLDEIMDNAEISEMGLHKETQAVYVENIVSLYNYIYPLYKHGDSEINHYVSLIKNNSKTRKRGYLLNNRISLKMRVRFFAICLSPYYYCAAMRLLKRGVK